MLKKLNSNKEASFYMCGGGGGFRYMSVRTNSCYNLQGCWLSLAAALCRRCLSSTRTLRIQVPDNWVVGVLVLVLEVQVFGQYIFIGNLNASLEAGIDFGGILSLLRIFSANHRDFGFALMAAHTGVVGTTKSLRIIRCLQIIMEKYSRNTHREREREREGERGRDEL